MINIKKKKKKQTKRNFHMNLPIMLKGYKY